MADNGVAIVRGKAIPTRTFKQAQYGTREDFVQEVIQTYTFNLDQRNTLTFEFVWDTYD